MNKFMSRFSITSALTAIAFLATGCEINGITGVSADGGAVTQSSSYSLLGHGFHNDYGSVQFQDLGSNRIQFFEVCNEGYDNCHAINREENSDFTVNVNDGRSYASRQVGYENWDSWMSGSDEQLTLITQVRDSMSVRIKTVRESFRISDYPCGYSSGRGLEARSITYYGSVTSGAAAATSCQVYY